MPCSSFSFFFPSGARSIAKCTFHYSFSNQKGQWKKEKEENTIERSNGTDIRSWSPMHPDRTPSGLIVSLCRRSLLHNLCATPRFARGCENQIRISRIIVCFTQCATYVGSVCDFSAISKRTKSPLGLKSIAHSFQTLFFGMANLLRAHKKRSKNCLSRISLRTWPGNLGMSSKRNFSVYGGLLVIYSNQEYPHTKPNKHGRIGARLWLDRRKNAPSLRGEGWGVNCLRGCQDLNFTRLA